MQTMILSALQDYLCSLDLDKEVQKSIYPQIVLQADSIQMEDIESRLSTAGMPEPDLFIRTGGEHRVSNFLLWQLAYSELYFTDVLWPDFDETEFELALTSFSGRQRRFGKTGDQVEAS